MVNYYKGNALFRRAFELSANEMSENYAAKIQPSTMPSLEHTLKRSQTPKLWRSRQASWNRFERCQAAGPESQKFSHSQNDRCDHQLNRQLFVSLTGSFLGQIALPKSIYILPHHIHPCCFLCFLLNDTDSWGSASLGVEDQCLLRLRNASPMRGVSENRYLGLTGHNSVLLRLVVCTGPALSDRALVGHDRDPESTW
jgi:hypothetical protein